MGLLTFIQIPCHRVLANEIYLNLKYRIGLKHFFNINLGIGVIKKTTFFVRIFDISFYVFTQILIERDRWMRNQIPHPTSTPSSYFWRTPLLDDIIITFFQVFLGFGVAKSVKSVLSGYSFNFASNELSWLKFE